MDIFKFRRKMNVLVLGSKGMLGSEVFNNLRKDSLNIGSMFRIVDGIDYPEIDISIVGALDNYFVGKVHYDYVINCAAITDTKGIQTNEQINHKSYEVNALACKFIAESCKRHGVKLIHISTDYVFSEEIAKNIGLKYENDQELNNEELDTFKSYSYPYPVNDYGMHKLIGELFIKNTLDLEDYAIVRVSWLYGANNNKSFVHKFLKNCYEKQKNSNNQEVEVEVVENECSCPTSTAALYRKIYSIMKHGLCGILHGIDGYGLNSIDSVSRFDFASEILFNFKNEFPNVVIAPIKSDKPEFGKMRYPEYSCMQKSVFNEDFERNWKEELEHFCNENRESIMSWLKNN